MEIIETFFRLELVITFFNAICFHPFYEYNLNA